MKANSSTFSFRVKAQIIRDKKYFVYHHKEYPVDFDLLKKNSDYFYKNRSQYQEEEYIEIINEEEEYVNLSEESIQAFICSCQNELCTIEKSSVIPLQYLAHKFEFTELIQNIDKFIEEHSDDLIFETLFFKIDQMKEKNNNYSFFDTSKEEKFISEHLTEFLQKEEMIKLPIPLLYFVFLESQHNKDDLKSDMTEFLFKCLDKYGRPASVLFNLIDFGEQRIEVVNRLLENYDSKQFDFNQINRTLTKTVQDLTSEVSKQKEEYFKIFKQMQETFNKQLAELKEMKKNEEEKQKQNEIENQKRVENFSTDVNKIKKEVDDKMKTMQEQFQQICNKQEEFIDNATVKKYLQMILETMTFGQFRKFDDILKEHFKTELVKIEEKNKEETIHAKVILDCISIPESYENIQIIQIFKGDVKNHSKIQITNNIIEELNQKEQLDSCLTKCANISDDLFVEIEYPCNKFEQKMKIISDIKKQKCQNMKVSVAINDKSYFEQEEYIDNADIIKYQEMFLESITFGQFRRFDDKSKENFIKGLYKSENEHKSENELLRTRLLLDLSSMADSCDYSQIVDFLRKSDNNQTKFKLAKDKVEDLNQKSINYCLINCVIAFNNLLFEIEIFKGDDNNHSTIKITNNNIIEELNQNEQLDSFLTKCINLTNDLFVEVEYLCNKFEQIMKIISDIKTQKCQNMKISVVINDKSYFDQKYEWNKIVNICKVGESIDSIPEEGFCDFCELSDFEMSPSTAEIGSSSFKNCISLSEIKIPISVKSIGDNCFDGCSKLDRISFNPFYTQVQFNTFNKCPSLKHFDVSTARESKSKTSERVLIPHKVTDIFNQTNFFDSSELTSYINECSEIIFETQYPSPNFSNVYQKIISLKQSISKIKIGIFYTQNGNETADKYFCNNKNINYVRFDSNIKRTPNDGKDSSDGSFQNCSSLIEIFVPSSFDRIGNHTFYGCSSLKKVNFEIPSFVTSIGDYAFYSCSSLAQIEIPNSVTSLGEGAFSLCSSLTQIEIPNSVTSIRGWAFNSCSSLTQIKIPKSVTSIGNDAFSHCSKLTQIEIPNSVTSIGRSAFIACSKLTHIKIPNSVTSIGNNAFNSCKSLTQIEIPNSVTSIGSCAFVSCSSLRKVTIPSRIDRSNLDINSNATINKI